MEVTLSNDPSTSAGLELTKDERIVFLRFDIIKKVISGELL
jgi:hypothetical protein